MSAIFGIFRHDGTHVTADELKLMATPFASQNSVGVQFFLKGCGGFGVTHFNSQETVRSPGDGDKRHLWAVGDTRIDNRNELIAKLRLSHTASDNQIIEQAHLKWGLESPGHILGAFSYAVWDSSQLSLTLVRDQIGVRPLYYSPSKEFTAFASDSRSLLALPAISRDVDDFGVLQFLLGQFLVLDKETTCFSSLKRLPPASTLQVSRHGEMSQKKYWSMDIDKEITLSGDGEYAEAFRERFTTAITRCMKGESAVGSTLSGGLDSSSIAKVASEVMKKNGLGPLHTFSGVFPATPQADESQFSRAVSSSGPFVPHEFSPNGEGPIARIIPVMSSFVQPIFAPNLTLAIRSCELARDNGVRILFDGTDGDTTVGHGFDLFLEMGRARDWKAFVAAVGAFSDRFGQDYGPMRFSMTNSYAVPELQKMTRQGKWLAVVRAVNVLGRGLELSRKQVWKSILNDRLGRIVRTPNFSHLAPDFSRRLSVKERLREVSQELAHFPATRHAIHFRGLNSGILPIALETLDFIGASHDIEYRFPFCDRELIEFCLAIPTYQQIKGGWSRWVLRNAMDGLLPEEVCWRKGKSNLSPTFWKGLLEFESKRFNEIANCFPDTLGPFLDKGAVQASNHRFQDGKGNANDFQLLWQAAVLDSWLRNQKK
jgi:asparagine synthase (glutamine-hydrolysing)